MCHRHFYKFETILLTFLIVNTLFSDPLSHTRASFTLKSAGKLIFVILHLPILIIPYGTLSIKYTV